MVQPVGRHALDAARHGRDAQVGPVRDQRGQQGAVEVLAPAPRLVAAERRQRPGQPGPAVHLAQYVLHPHLRQITFGGGDLATFSPAGPDTFLYLLLPPPGRTELTIDQSFSWEAHAQLPDEDKPVGAYYTLRHWRPVVQELDMLCVLRVSLS